MALSSVRALELDGFLSGLRSQIEALTDELRQVRNILEYFTIAPPRPGVHGKELTYEWIRESDITSGVKNQQSTVDFAGEEFEFVGVLISTALRRNKLVPASPSGRSLTG